MRKPYGKSLSGFIFGLLLATVIIAGVLIFLNKNQTRFKEPERVQELPKPEILTPASSNSSSSLPAPTESASDAIASDPLGDLIHQQEAASEAANVSKSTTDEENAGNLPALPEEQTKSQPARKPNNPPAREQTSKPARPTPEQILNSGSIEKARQEVQQAQNQAQKNQNNGASSRSQGRVVVQMGSFNNHQSADAQRAKLAMLGIQAQVVQGNVGGKTVYRVQSAKISSQEAQQLRNKLNHNGVDSLTRQAN